MKVKVKKAQLAEEFNVNKREWVAMFVFEDEQTALRWKDGSSKPRRVRPIGLVTEEVVE